MSAQAGQPGQAPLGQKADQRETSDLAFLDNIEELNTNWPDYQVRAGTLPPRQQHGCSSC
jgi:hypothetical protein